MFRIMPPLLALLCLVLLYTACETPLETSLCAKSSDCAAGSVCFFGACHSSSPTLSVYAVVTPPATTSLKEEHILRPFDLAADNFINIEMTPQAAGQIRVKGISSGTAILAAERTVPGLSNNHSYHLVNDGASDSTVSYLLPAGDYRFFLIPTNRALPIYEEVLHLDGSNLNPIAYPHEELVSYHGTVQWESGSYSPISGAQISGKVQNGRVCGTSYSGADGTYDLNCWDGSSLAFLAIRQGEENPLVPDLDLTISNKDLNNFTIKTVFIGEKLPLSYQLPGQILTSSGAPLSGGSVVLIETLGRGSYRTAANSKQDGRFVLNVWGEQLAVITAVADNYNRSILSLILPKDGSSEGFSLILEPALTLSGTVIDSREQKPIANAQITAIPIYSSQSAELFKSPAKVTHSNNQGQYTLKLEHGDYYLEVIPPPSALLPRVRQFIRLLKSGQHHIFLPKAQLTEGLVTLNGKAVAEAKIDIYSPDVTTSGVPQLLGRAISDKEGRFVLVLPAL